MESWKNGNLYRVISIALSFSLILTAVPVLHAQEKPEDHLKAGIKYYDHGRTDEAIAELATAINLGLRDSWDRIDAHKYLGLAYVRKGSISQARASFGRLLELNPKYRLSPQVPAAAYELFEEVWREAMEFVVAIITVPKEAKVYINGRLVGITPLTRSLRRGSYEVRISKDEYQDWTQRVLVDKDRKIEVKLEKLQVVKEGRGMGGWLVLLGLAAIGGMVKVLTGEEGGEGGGGEAPLPEPPAPPQ